MSGPFDRDPSGRLPEPVDVELERALEHAAPPLAREEFRADLRERFVRAGAGTGAGADARAGAGAAADAPRTARRAPRPATASRRRGWTAAAALVAAGLVLAFFLLRDDAAPADPGAAGELAGVDGTPARAADPADAPPAPRANGGAWTVLAADGAIRVDEQPVAAADAGALERALVGARRVSVGAGGTLRLRLGDLMLVELGSPDEESRMVLAGCYRIPREGSGRAIEALAGGVRVATGPDFDGLSVATPDLDLAITGTVLAVDVYPNGTCVCCAEGNVAVTDRGRSCSHALAPGEMAYVHRDASCEEGDVLPSHAAPLDALQASARDVWGPR